MAGERIADLDELVLRCRVEGSRAFIREAASCYRAGAFRACIVVTYVAVLYDFISKLRELELTGDANAAKRLREIENARATNDHKAALKFEHNLLEVVRDEFELISHTEFTDLDRLREDRNRCAHPSLSRPAEEYEPTAELARYHLTNAVLHVLQHAPVQGKAALSRIWDEVQSQYFPLTREDAQKLLSVGPLSRARDSLVRDVVIGLTKSLLRDNLTEHERNQRFAALGAVLELHRERVEKILRLELPGFVAKLGDELLGNAVAYCRRIREGWIVLDASAHEKLKRFIRNCPIEVATIIISDALRLSEIRPAAVTRLGELPADRLTELARREADEAVLDAAVDRLLRSFTYDAVKVAMRKVIAPVLEQLSDAQMKKVLEFAATSSDFKDNFGRMDFLRDLFKYGQRESLADSWRAVHNGLSTVSSDEKHFRQLLEKTFPSLVEPAGEVT